MIIAKSHKDVPEEILLYAYLSLLSNLLQSDRRARDNYGDYIKDMFYNLSKNVEDYKRGNEENEKAFREYFGKKV